MSEINKFESSYSFLVIGKTTESKETQEQKRYIGVGSSYVIAVNPNKEELEKIYGTDQDKEPEYVVNTERGKEARIHFIVKTDPEQCDGIEITSRLMFSLRNAPAYNRDETKVQVIDQYGNTTWANTEDVKAGKKLLSSEGKELKIDTKYRMCCVGEADLVGFLKTYLCVGDVFKYVNGSWIKKDNPEEYAFALEHIKDYFNGNFTELRDALKLQPNNKVKLLYGVRTTEENRQYQAVAAREDLILPNSAGTNALARMEKALRDLKERGSYPTTEFKVQPLMEFTLEPTNLEKKEEDAFSSEAPW